MKVPLVKQSPDFKKCLNNGRLVKVEIDLRTVAREVDLAHSDLSEGEASIERGSNKWATVQAYYAMFHAAKALVHQKGYREKSHQCLAIALRELYVRAGKLDEQMLMEIEDARALREEANCRGSFTEAAANHSIHVAKQFVEITVKLISESQQ